MKDLFPDLEISRHVWLAVRFPFHAGKQNEKIGYLTEDAPGGAGLKIGSAKIVVKALQASAFGEVLALRFADAGQDIEVRGEPSVVLGEQMDNELARVVGTRSH